MLEIYVNNKKINLPENININMTWENPFLLQNRIPSPYSMSFTLPGTKENYEIFGNPQRLASTELLTESESRAVFNLITFLKGKLIFKEVKKNIKVFFKGDILPSQLRKNMNNIELERFDFGQGSRIGPNFTDDWSKVYLDTIFYNATKGEKFACCTIKIEEASWPWDEINNHGVAAAIQKYFNFFNVPNGSYLLDQASELNHSSIFPQPYIHELISQAFGDTMGINPFKDDPELKTLVLISTYHKLYADLPGSYNHGVILDNTNETPSIANYFKLNSFLNSIAFNDILKDLLKMFCLSLMPRIDGKWDIVSNKSILESTDVEDWSDKMIGIPIITYEEGLSYAYGYSDYTDQIVEEGTNHELESIKDLLLASPGTYYIQGTQELYEKTLKDKKEETDPDEYEYELQNTGLAGKTTENNSYDMTSAIAPLPMCIGEYWTEEYNIHGIPKFPIYVPNFKGDRRDNSQSPSIGFNRGFIKPQGLEKTHLDYVNLYPYLSPYCYDMNGMKKGNYSLAWQGEEGLINQFHQEFKTYIEKKKKVLTAYFKLSELDLKNTNYKKKKHINGMNFFLRKSNGTIKKNKIGLIKCELIQA